MELLNVFLIVTGTLFILTCLLLYILDREQILSTSFYIILIMLGLALSISGCIKEIYKAEDNNIVFEGSLL